MKRTCAVTVVAALAAGFASFASAEEAQTSVFFGGRLIVPAFDTKFEPKCAGGNWCFNGGSGGFEPAADGAYHFKMYPDLCPEIDATMRLSTPAADAIRADYVVKFAGDAKPRGFFVNLELLYETLAKGAFFVDGVRTAIPEGRKHFKYQKNLRRVAVARADGAKMEVEIVSEGGVIGIQNNRPWGSESASVRICFPREADNSFKGGKPYALSILIKGAGPIDLTRPQIFKIAEGPDWVPVRMRGPVQPGSALDFSNVCRRHAPAGKYGRVVAKGAHFEFERLPGVEQRFYGANLCFGANTPKKDAAKRFAEDFARRGYNSVRIHHHERPLIEGMKDPAALTLNPKAMDRFDALVAACVGNGIYLTTDLFVSRTPIAYRAIGIDRDGNLPTMDFKYYVPIHPGAWSNYCAWVRLFLTHRNPYTGRSLAEEPALACLSLVNEGPLTHKSGDFYSSVPEWKNAWLKWISAKRAADPKAWGKVRDEIPSTYGDDVQSAAFLAFLAEVEGDFAARVRHLVHDELGCRVPLTNMNNGNSMSMQGVRDAAYEYVDDHFYVDHPRFLGKPWSLPSECPNVNPVQNERAGAIGIAYERSFDRPFAVSEYNFCGPGRYRGVGGILTAAEGALQGWSALWRFAWTHNIAMVGDFTTGSVSSFDAAGDPLAQASDRASLCLFLRGDLQPLASEYPIRFPDGVKDAPNPLMGKKVAMAWAWAIWYRRVGLTLKDRPGQLSLADAYARTDREVRADLGLPADVEAWPAAGDGAVRVDPKEGTFVISTLRTSGGFTGGREIRSIALDATLDGQAATVWASALDNEPIASSRRILVTHLPDVQNDGVTYADKELRILLAHGKRRPVMRATKAAIALRCAEGAKVYALGVDGSRRHEVAATYADGALRFVSDTAADKTEATFLYEVVWPESASRCTKSVYDAKLFSQVPVQHWIAGDHDRYLADVRAAGVDCVLASFGDQYAFGAKRAAFFDSIGQEIRFFEQAGIPVMVWTDTLSYCAVRTGTADGKKRFGGAQPLVGVGGHSDGPTCPLDEMTQAYVCETMTDIAKAGARFILIDDDFVQSARGRLGCACPRHLARVSAKVGHAVTREEVLASFAGKPNPVRTAFVDVTGEVALEFARLMRAAVDSVNPEIVMGLCLSYTHWDVEGVDMDALLGVLAGPGRRPIVRISGAPYWWDGKYHNAGLEGIVEFVRTQAEWTRGKGWKVFDENDPHPRKVALVPAWRCELYDKATLADGLMDRHKYMLCYGPDRKEPGYLEAHLANMKEDVKIRAVFANTEPAGVYVPFAKRRIREATLPTPCLGENELTRLFSFPMASALLVKCGIPVRHDPSPTAYTLDCERLGVDLNTVDFAKFPREEVRDRILQAAAAAGHPVPVYVETKAPRIYLLLRYDPAKNGSVALVENFGNEPADLRLVTQDKTKSVEIKAMPPHTWRVVQLPIRTADAPVR